MNRPCGIYKTTEAIGESVPAGALVYYHDHGDPGPGVYLPSGWENNRAIFHERGTTVPREDYAETLQSLLGEGFYRVKESFYCCSSKCQHFEEQLMVQLGYNGDAQAILFVPTLVGGAVAIPAEGTHVDDAQLAALDPLKVPIAQKERPKEDSLQ